MFLLAFEGKGLLAAVVTLSVEIIYRTGILFVKNSMAPTFIRYTAFID